MLSNRPYIIRAMYDWIVDNQWTPHVQVDANYPGVNVPQEYVQDDVIVLNMNPSAVVGLSMANDWFTFKARFKGIETTLGFPPEAVLAIFARENGHGMPFPPEPYPEGYDEPEDKPSLKSVESSKDDKSKTESKTGSTSKKSDKKKPSLSIVK